MTVEAPVMALVRVNWTKVSDRQSSPSSASTFQVSLLAVSAVKAAQFRFHFGSISSSRRVRHLENSSLRM